jgi:hypothetical protein
MNRQGTKDAKKTRRRNLFLPFPLGVLGALVVANLSLNPR